MNDLTPSPFDYSPTLTPPRDHVTIVIDDDFFLADHTDLRIESHNLIQSLFERREAIARELFDIIRQEEENVNRAIEISNAEATRARMHPSKKDAVERCPRRKVGRGNGKHMDPCTVCLCAFHGNSYYRELPCGHKFHPKCVDRWLLQEDGRCPNCNQRV